MRSRLAIIAMLVFGMVLSTGGGALAVSGFTSQDDSAALSQYGPNVTPNDAPDDNGGDEGGGVLGDEDSGAPAPDTGGGGDQGDQGVQPARQVEAGTQSPDEGGQLPFTGFAAIPILLGGVALLSTGLLLRRRTGDRTEG